MVDATPLASAGFALRLEVVAPTNASPLTNRTPHTPTSWPTRPAGGRRDRWPVSFLRGLRAVTNAWHVRVFPQVLHMGGWPPSCRPEPSPTVLEVGAMKRSRD